jgi:PhzF family phenazine biosynthesis protein
MNYYIVDAFTSEPFGGNPAGVVLLGKDTPFPDDGLMLKIAAELRYSETAFVQQNGSTEFTVRYFTPMSEVDLCGHATIATFGVLLQEGIVADGTTCINHTLAGDLTVSVGEQVMMQMATPQALDTPIDSLRLNRIMGLPDNPVTGLSPEVISTGLPDIIMPIASVDLLQRIAPDMEALTPLSRELNVVGVHAFAMAEDGYTAHVRNFAPLYGIPEESATGTANAALTHYLALHSIVSGTARCRFLQGEAMGRPSIITTEIRPDGTIHVGGPSRIVAQGTLYP